MLDLLRMDLFRMRKMQSFIVITLIITALAALSTYSSKLERDMYKENQKEEIQAALDENEDLINEEAEDAEYEEEDEGDVDIGMAIDSALEDMSKPYVDQMFASFVAGMFPALMIIIFTVLFVNADMHSGFIKSIGGQVRQRWQIVISKFICVLIFTLYILIYVALIQAVLNFLFFGEVNIYSTNKFIRYIVLAFLMNGALAIFSAFITTLFRSNLVGLIIGIIDVLGMFSIVSFFVNLVVKKINENSDFNLNEYLLSYCVNKTSYGSTFSSMSHELTVAACFFVVSVAASCIIFEKRDIV